MKHSYKHYAELQDKVRLMVYTEQPLPLTQDTIESLAYVTRNGSSVTSYKVFISGCCYGIRWGHTGSAGPSDAEPGLVQFCREVETLFVAL